MRVGRISGERTRKKVGERARRVATQARPISKKTLDMLVNISPTRTSKK